jgi:hypothetical protein
MGHRTVVVFNNDHLDVLRQDQEIGRKIQLAILKYCVNPDEAVIGNLGYVAEQAHADLAKLVIIGNKGQFGLVELAGLHNSHNDPECELTLLKQAADNMGYSLVKKQVKDDSK